MNFTFTSTPLRLQNALNTVPYSGTAQFVTTAMELSFPVSKHFLNKMPEMNACKRRFTCPCIQCVTILDGFRYNLVSGVGDQQYCMSLILIPISPAQNPLRGFFQINHFSLPSFRIVPSSLLFTLRILPTFLSVPFTF